ncbi:hypothetical protein [Microbacterium hominis]|uniref:hypothetical protein n=1 Tax=Microbacterium hominis TaxID=162426 RepID=UPI0012E09B26|nr:hypothetical protein [Microbacterium hominis]
MSTNAKATTLSRTPAPTVPNHNTNANHRAMGGAKSGTDRRTAARERWVILLRPRGEDPKYTVSGPMKATTHTAVIRIVLMPNDGAAASAKSAHHEAGVIATEKTARKPNTKNDESCPPCDPTGFEVTRLDSLKRLFTDLITLARLSDL